ncbi:helix-turn-helix domain-containing protein [Aphanothece microscopica]|uniref:helix-turn-helix domain-containing protein n=1 Tax=Aphanothece microscopica TaxID=1049561 RepID=UPI0039851695
MSNPPADWHAEDVKAAVRKTGVSLTALARQHGLSESAVRMTLRRSWPRVEAIIARHLGKKPQAIWPSRYDARGRPLPGLHAADRQHRSRPAPTPHRQKAEVA